MAKCAVCGAENKNAAYVLMIRRDGSEAEMCASCADLINNLDNAKNKAASLKMLKKHALGCGDYEVRRFLDGIIAAGDEPESFNEYVELSRERVDKSKQKPKRDMHRLVRPAALVLIIAIALYGILHTVADIISGDVVIGLIGLLLTAIIDGSLLIILSAVMDALDDVRTMRKRIR